MVASLAHSEAIKILGRKALLVTALVVSTGIVVLTVLVLAIARANEDSGDDIALGGRDALDSMVAALIFGVVIFGALIGARAGAYDQEKGLVRYWAMTGTPRSWLFGVRAPVAVGVVFAAFVPSIVLAIVLAVILPTDGDSAVSAGDALVSIWEVALAAILWTTLSVAIGALLGGSGGAIAVSLVVALLGNTLVSLLALIDEPLGWLALSNAQSVLSGTDAGDGPVWAAVLVALVWLAVPLAAAATRVWRAEL